MTILENLIFALKQYLDQFGIEKSHLHTFKQV